jgi:hypothetical protein
VIFFLFMVRQETALRCINNRWSSAVFRHDGC